jgi:hypothetical protein
VPRPEEAQQVPVAPLPPDRILSPQESWDRKPFWEKYVEELKRTLSLGVQDQFPLPTPEPVVPPRRPTVPMPLVPGPAQTSRRPVYGGVV